MNLEDIKAKNGISLQALCDFLLESAAQAGCRGIFIVVKPPSAKDSPYAIVTNVASAAIPGALEGIAREMRVAMAEERDAKKVADPS